MAARGMAERADASGAFELEPAGEPTPGVCTDAEPAPPEDPTRLESAAPPQFEDAVPVDAEAAVAELAVPKMRPPRRRRYAVGATDIEAEVVERPAEPGPDADPVTPEAPLAAADPDPAPTISAAERSETLSLVARSEREGNETMADQAEPTPSAPGSQDDDAPARSRTRGGGKGRRRPRRPGRLAEFAAG